MRTTKAIAIVFARQNLNHRYYHHYPIQMQSWIQQYQSSKNHHDAQFSPLPSLLPRTRINYMNLDPKWWVLTCMMVQFRRWHRQWRIVVEVVNIVVMHPKQMQMETRPRVDSSNINNNLTDAIKKITEVSWILTTSHPRRG